MLLKKAIAPPSPKSERERECLTADATTARRSPRLGDDAVVAGEMLADECVAAWQLRPN
jgi:hypothetical protein